MPSASDVDAGSTPAFPSNVQLQTLNAATFDWFDGEPGEAEDPRRMYPPNNSVISDREVRLTLPLIQVRVGLLVNSLY